ncbi:hypothetical protein [Oryzifoliimicrobium ureilyticus]|uniref:hypothetical protein n=1 Tax=Oryzifoliimicrobium ureilyticus TaxID=3113724 RepID=UPI003075EFBA
MANIHHEASDLRLGVFTRLSEAFVWLRSKLLFVLMVDIVALILGGLPFVLLFAYYMGAAQTPSTVLFMSVAGLWSFLVQQVAVGMLTLAAEDARLGYPSRFSAYLSSVLPRLFVLIVLSLAVFILIMVGIMAFFVPGLWLLGVFAVIQPVLLIDDARWDALSRCWTLTKGYRWPIIAAFVIFYIGWTVIRVLAGLIAFGSPLVSIIIEVTLSIVAYSYLPILMVSVHARLRAIKEGGAQGVAGVFE